MRKSGQGFTLVELLITIAIAAILATIAIPSYRAMVRKNSVINQADGFLNVLMLARSEAVRRNRNVTVCKNTNTTTPACTTSGTWDAGILVYADTDGDGAYDAGEEIRVEVPITKSAYITGSSASGQDVSSLITFRPDGTPGVLTGIGTFTIQPSSSDAFCQRLLEVNITGQAKVRSTSVSCSS